MQLKRGVKRRMGYMVKKNNGFKHIMIFFMKVRRLECRIKLFITMPQLNLIN